ncbi:MAG: hypothetical protein KDJ46_03645 [Rhodobiaceae bacterium]|nr:hypothetical protein [Rhodobiaceae bacterium]
MTRRDIAWRKIRSQFIRFRRLSALRIAADYRRAARLRAGRSLALPQAGRGGERLVVSMTTIPERIDTLVPTLLSLREQTRAADRIILALPEKSLRSGKPYALPADLPKGIDILRCVDTGPSTKLLPALLAEPEALVVAVDDDMIYPHDFLQTLVEAHRSFPAAALGWRGWRLEPGVDPRHFEHVWGSAVAQPTEVDILLGVWGYLIPPGALDKGVHDYAGWPDEVRWVDDVWVAAHLARRKVPRLVVPAPGLPIPRHTSRLAALTFGLNASGHNDRVAIHAFADWW